MERDGEEEQGNGNVGKLSMKLEEREAGKKKRKGRKKGGRNSLFTLHAFTLLNSLHNEYFCNLKQ